MSDICFLPMTLGNLATATGLVMRALRISDRCVQRSTAYDDHVTLLFHVPNPMPEDHRAVQEVYGCLCKRHGWEPPKVNTNIKRDTITVTLQKSSVISSDGNRRMPL